MNTEWKYIIVIVFAKVWNILLLDLERPDWKSLIHRPLKKNENCLKLSETEVLKYQFWLWAEGLIGKFPYWNFKSCWKLPETYTTLLSDIVLDALDGASESKGLPRLITSKSKFFFSHSDKSSLITAEVLLHSVHAAWRLKRVTHGCSTLLQSLFLHGFHRWWVLL